MAYKFNPFTAKLEEYGPVLTGTGTVSAAADGTAALPGIAFTNNLSTGIYRPGLNQLAISTNGTGRLFVDATGRVGIGTASPAARLDVVGTGASFTDASINASATGTYGHTFSVGNNLATYFSKDNNGELRLGRSNTSIGGGSIAGIGTGGLALSTSTDNSTYSERARIDSSGRLLVGTSSAASNVYVKGDLASSAATTPVQQLAVSSANYNGASIISYNASGYAGTLSLASSKNSAIGANTSVVNGQAVGVLSFSGNDGTNFIPCAEIKGVVDGIPGADDMPGRLVFSTTADGAASPTERMRITSDGRAVFGGLTTTVGNTTSNIIVGTAGTTSGSVGIEGVTSLTTLRYHVVFSNGNGRVGSISTDGTATAYTTSSDYRLKENVTPVTDGITRLQQLKPSRFNFIADPDTVVDGFIAHEVQSVVPEAITGEKDAVDDDGNPQYQGIDQSKLVPLLTAALQEAIAKIETLEARLTAAGL